MGAVVVLVLRLDAVVRLAKRVDVVAEFRGPELREVREEAVGVEDDVAVDDECASAKSNDELNQPASN